MNIEIPPRVVFTKFLCLIFVLLFFNIVGIISKFYLNNNAYGLIPLFDFSAEKNIPTFFSSVILLFASSLLSIIAVTNKRNGAKYLAWLWLAIIFLYLSIDEIASIHEMLTDPVRKLFNTSGLLYYAWVIPYGIALIVFVVVYFKFLIRLPNYIKRLFVISGATFVSGAIGFELFGGRHFELHGRDNLIYSSLYTCEEFLEMLGIVIFIYALLLYIVIQFKSLTIIVNESK